MLGQGDGALGRVRRPAPASCTSSDVMATSGGVTEWQGAGLLTRGQVYACAGSIPAPSADSNTPYDLRTSELDVAAAESGWAGAPKSLYRTIVADPPWDHSDGTGWNPGSRDWRGRSKGEPRATKPPYESMTLDEIAALPIPLLAERDAHLYVWTTQRYLRASFELIEGWGFAVSATLVWCKAPMGFMGGAFRSSTEFIQFARRGNLSHLSQAPQRWFTWPRVGWTQSDSAAKHSRKPEAFLDLVEQVSPGPYLELFARRNRLGWDTWGNQSHEHVGVA